MASTCALSVAMPLTHKKTTLPPTTSTSFFNPLTLKLNSKITTPAAAAASKQRLVVVKSSMKENAVTALTAAVLTASMVVPEVAQAASGVTPSLNNFLLSIGAGGIVLGGILGAIIGVSNFDPVKRG
ncbi:putative photosystem II PsbX [Helianthus annuus]|nr:putative photosystem II PsbX [Helianthus annuus]